MSFSCSSEAPPILGDTEADSEIARPRPEDGGIGEGHIKILTAASQVGVPHRLRGGGKGETIQLDSVAHALAKSIQHTIDGDHAQ